MEVLDCQQELRNLKCCVIIPTYNNQKTLNRVIDSVLNYTDAVIVVVDGATDSTPQIVESYGEQVTQIQYQPNRGKGYALRTGFKKAVELGFDYAITIDSDGQHFAEDIPAFVKKIKENPGALIVGSRNMDQEGVPGKSSFGNKFSNFWFLFETGIKLPDTQSGYRLYPVKALSKVSFYTTKFEFEIEVIVKAAWRGIPVISTPIKVLYDPDERVTHFRPFKDFTRISILNTYLVFLAILYYRPRLFLLQAKKKSLKQFITDTVLKSNDSIEKKSLSVMLGIFVGCAPMWGYQTVSVLGLATLLRLNRPIAFLASNISIPPILPFIIWGSFKCGELVTGIEVVFDFTQGIEWNMLKEHLVVYIIGSLIFSVLMALFAGAVTYAGLKAYRKTT